MTLSERIAEQVAQLPPEMAALVERQLAAGNVLTDLEIGRGERAGRVALVMDHPFRDPLAEPPAGLTYREWANGQLMLFEYHTADEKWSLLTAKFKPIAFDPLPSPPDAMAEHMERVRLLQEAEVAEESAVVTGDAKVAVPAPPPTPADAARRFLASMTMTFDMWHDGNGYDLAALAQVPATELPAIEATLLARQPPDWRDVEALARIDTPAARAAVVAALRSGDGAVRREAMRHAADDIDPAERERFMLNALNGNDLSGGLSRAIDEAAEFHPPAVIEALMRGLLSRRGDVAMHFAALLYYLHGKADDPFDWDQRPCFLRFHTESGPERMAAFRELCQTIGVDPATYGAAT